MKHFNINPDTFTNHKCKLEDGSIVNYDLARSDLSDITNYEPNTYTVLGFGTFHSVDVNGITKPLNGNKGYFFKYKTENDNINVNTMKTDKLKEQEQTFSFLLPDNMKLLGFDCIKDNNGYYEYKNDGTKHYNKDYNPKFPEPKGKVIINVNINYVNPPFINAPNIGIYNDGDTRTSYNGVCPNEEFLINLLNNIR